MASKERLSAVIWDVTYQYLSMQDFTSKGNIST